MDLKQLFPLVLFYSTWNDYDNLANGVVFRRPGIILFNLEGGAWKIQVLIILEKASGCCFLTGGSFKTRFNFNVFERVVSF